MSSAKQAQAAEQQHKYDFLEKNATMMDPTFDEMKTRYTHAVQESNKLKSRLRTIKQEQNEQLKEQKKNLEMKFNIERQNFKNYNQELRNQIEAIHRRQALANREPEMMESFDVESVVQAQSWKRSAFAVGVMLTFWMVEWNSFFFGSLMLPPVSVFLLACFECMRGRHHSIFQLMPWNEDRIQAQLFFDRRDFTQRNSYAWATFRTMIAASVLCVFGWLPGVLFAGLLWANYFLVRSKTWWRAIFSGDLLQASNVLSGHLLERLQILSNHQSEKKQE